MQIQLYIKSDTSLSPQKNKVLVPLILDVKAPPNNKKNDSPKKYSVIQISTTFNCFS